MIKALSFLPPFKVLFWSGVGLAVLFGFNYMMADMMSDDIALYDGVCQVSQYDTETQTGKLTCGEHTATDGGKVMDGFVGSAYIEKKSISCKITESSYVKEIKWVCEAKPVHNE